MLGVRFYFRGFKRMYPSRDVTCDVSFWQSPLRKKKHLNLTSKPIPVIIDIVRLWKARSRSWFCSCERSIVQCVVGGCVRRPFVSWRCIRWCIGNLSEEVDSVEKDSVLGGCSSHNPERLAGRCFIWQKADFPPYYSSSTAFLQYIFPIYPVLFFSLGDTLI